MNDQFVYSAEITLAKPFEQAAVDSRYGELTQCGVTNIYLSDQAGAGENMVSINDYLDSMDWTSVNIKLLVPIVATRRRSWSEIEGIMSRLSDMGIKHAFIIGGDDKAGQSGPTSAEVIKKYEADFKLGAAIHPQADASADYDTKLAAGASYFVAQASYGQASFDAWLKAWGKDAIAQSDVTGLVIPPTSRGVIRIISGLDDVHVSSRFKRSATRVKGDDLEPWGIEYARKRVAEFKSLGMSGAYVYSRSPRIVASVLGKQG